MNTILLVPTFPRPRSEWNIYTHALDRDTLLTNIEELKRIDLQLIAMINDATDKMSEKGIVLKEKILIMGFSASGMFANRFTTLHPEIVQAAVIGSPGGWPIAPVSEADGTNLRYPIGIGDINEITGEDFDIETFKTLPLYFYLGDEDTNDSVPYNDGYDAKDKALIFKYFGDSPVKRWPVAEEIYNSAGCSSQFILYHEVGHNITREIARDIIDFFKKNM